MEISKVMEIFGMGVIFGIFMCYVSKLIQVIFDTFKKFF